MKNMTMVGMIVATVLLAGCGEKDRAYYENNLQDASEKNEQCQTELKDALLNFNKEKIMSLKDDQECNIAHDVVRIQKAKEREEQRAIEVKKEEEKKAKEKIAFEQEYQKQLSLLRDMDYENFYNLKNNCRSVGFLGTTLEDAKCKAYYDLKDDKKMTAMENLIETVGKEDFLAYKDKSCENGAFGTPKCDTANDAYTLLLNRQTTYYEAHQDELKKDFNACTEKIDALQKAGKWKETQPIKKTYTCYTASQAAMKIFRVYGFTIIK